MSTQPCDLKILCRDCFFILFYFHPNNNEDKKKTLNLLNYPLPWFDVDGFNSGQHNGTTNRCYTKLLNYFVIVVWFKYLSTQSHIFCIMDCYNKIGKKNHCAK